MSWAITAVVSSAVISAGSSAYQADQEGKARDKAEQQAKEDRANALRAEQFANTEGEGQGSLGNINLAIDEDVDDDVLSGKSNISI